MPNFKLLKMRADHLSALLADPEPGLASWSQAVINAWKAIIDQWQLAGPTLPTFDHPETGLHGSEIINRLQRGHMVRRACWIDGYYVRICNEKGFDEQGLAVFDDVKDSLYTHATNGFFAHLGFSGQPFKVRHYGGEGDGVNCFFANDWEDYGFISNKDFHALTEETKNDIRRMQSKLLKEVR